MSPPIRGNGTGPQLLPVVEAMPPDAPRWLARLWAGVRANAGKIALACLPGLAAGAVWLSSRASRGDVEARAALVEEHIATERAERAEDHKACDRRHDVADASLRDLHGDFRELRGGMRAMMRQMRVTPTRDDFDAPPRERVRPR